MNTSDLRDMLAMYWYGRLRNWKHAYESADDHLTALLDARETKWAVCEDGKVVTVYDTCDEAEKHCGIGRVVLPYKEPKP